ncbi:MAG TPA: hypothetical protein VG797_03970 [Phycisphaerales bacterium]|nr:hypothetical protein [Phycisphaerales bacterium]
MKQHGVFGYGLISSAALVVGVLALARAGDVNPPAGPVQPTMRTLEEIYALLAQQASGSSQQWSYWHRNGAAGTVVVVPSAGVLHGIIFNPCNGCSAQELFDGNSTDVSSATPIALLPGPNSGSAPVFMPFDIEFHTGLTYRSVSGSGAVTLIYRAK